MSNEVLNEGFFGNSNISPAEKLYLISLLLGGTYEEKYLDPEKKVLSIGSNVIQKGKTNQFICITPGVRSSLEEIACKSKLIKLGVDKSFPVDKVFTGEFSDKEIFSKMSDYYRNGFNLDKTKIGESSETIDLGNIKRYMEVLRQKDNYITNNPELCGYVVDMYSDCYGISKKKVAEQMAN